MASKVTIIPWYKNVCCGDRKPSSSLDTAQSARSSSQTRLWWGSPSRSLLTGLISVSGLLRVHVHLLVLSLSPLGV